MKYVILLLTLAGSIPSVAQKLRPLDLHNGDLLFQDLDCGPMCDAIEAVTTGYHGRHFSHVGLVKKDSATIWVMESIGDGVHLIALDSFMQRSVHPVTVGRLKNKYRSIIPAAVRFCTQQTGTPYDNDFIYDNGKYYCSELVYDAFKAANGNKPFFTLQPMTFKQPGSNTFFPVWEAYFKKSGKPVPEGKPGCNPGGLSRSGKISIIGVLQ